MCESQSSSNTVVNKFLPQLKSHEKQVYFVTRQNIQPETATHAQRKRCTSQPLKRHLNHSYVAK